VNVSRAIKKLGGESLLLYPARGLTEGRFQQLLDQEGLNHRPFPIEGLLRREDAERLFENMVLRF
jgi:6-phosphofructokinase 2